MWLGNMTRSVGLGGSEEREMSTGIADPTVASGVGVARKESRSSSVNGGVCGRC